MLRPTPILAMRPSMSLHMRPSAPLFRAAPSQDEGHRAHTISQRIRQLKKIPPELIPLGVVLGIAIGAAVWSMGHKLYIDKQLRLSRQGGKRH